MEIICRLTPQAALPRHRQRLLPAGVPVKGHAALPNGTVKESLVIWREAVPDHLRHLYSSPGVAK